MKIASFVTYQEDSHPKIALATLDTASGHTESHTFPLFEYSVLDDDVVYEDSGKGRNPAFPADKYLFSADHIVRYTDDTLFSWLKGDRILFETHQSISGFRKFIGLEIGDYIPTVVFDDSEIEAELDLTLGVENGIRTRFESLSDHLNVESQWEKGCLSLCMLAFGHINRKALAAEKAEGEKQREAEQQAVYKAVKASQSAETKKRLESM